MPAGDGTGPMGLGPTTGRAAGYCAGYALAETMNPMPGRGRGMGGFGRGRGGGRHGWRHRFHATGQPFWAREEVSRVVPLGAAPAPAEEATMLKERAGHLEQTLEQIRQRIVELEATTPQEC